MGFIRKVGDKILESGLGRLTTDLLEQKNRASSKISKMKNPDVIHGKQMIDQVMLKLSSLQNNNELTPEQRLGVGSFYALLDELTTSTGWFTEKETLAKDSYYDIIDWVVPPNLFTLDNEVKNYIKVLLKTGNRGSLRNLPSYEKTRLAVYLALRYTEILHAVYHIDQQYSRIIANVDVDVMHSNIKSCLRSAAIMLKTKLISEDQYNGLVVAILYPQMVYMKDFNLSSYKEAARLSRYVENANALQMGLSRGIQQIFQDEVAIDSKRMGPYFRDFVLAPLESDSERYWFNRNKTYLTYYKTLKEFMDIKIRCDEADRNERLHEMINDSVKSGKNFVANKFGRGTNTQPNNTATNMSNKQTSGQGFNNSQMGRAQGFNNGFGPNMNQGQMNRNSGFGQGGFGQSPNGFGQGGFNQGQSGFGQGNPMGYGMQNNPYDSSLWDQLEDFVTKALKSLYGANKPRIMYEVMGLPKRQQLELYTLPSYTIQSGMTQPTQNMGMQAPYGSAAARNAQMLKQRYTGQTMRGTIKSIPGYDFVNIAKRCISTNGLSSEFLDEIIENIKLANEFFTANSNRILPTTQVRLFVVFGGADLGGCDLVVSMSDLVQNNFKINERYLNELAKALKINDQVRQSNANAKSFDTLDSSVNSFNFEATSEFSEAFESDEIEDADITVKRDKNNYRSEVHRTFDDIDSAAKEIKQNKANFGSFGLKFEGSDS